MVRGFAVGIALCGDAEADFEAVDTRGQSPCAFPHTGDSPYVSEPSACGIGLVVDGRYQCAVVATRGDCLGLGIGMFTSVETAFMG